MASEAHQPGHSQAALSSSTQDPGQVLDSSLEGEGNGHHQTVKEEGASVASNVRFFQYVVQQELTERVLGCHSC